VLEIRKRLIADPWAQVGSGAIAWEMAKLGFDPPQSRTTEPILARAGVPKRRSRPDRYIPKGTPYPAQLALPRPNAIHEVDLVGPRHLEGAVSFHFLNAMDLGRRKAAIEILPSKSEREVATGLVAIWSRLGIPELVKFDNGKTLQGIHGHMALPVRLALTAGARVRFIPFGEPWRNGVIEHFNDVFDKRFFRAQRFGDLDALKEQAGVFEVFHNSHHRYTALKGATPDESEKRGAFDPQLLDPQTVTPTQFFRHR
jgi:putative transposase